VMKRLYPNLTDEKRTIKARKMFFSSVVKNIKQNPDFKNKEIVDYFSSLKNKYRLALITTNTKPALEKILSITQFLGLFDIIETLEETEKDDKRAVFDRFVKKHGKPVIYIGGDKKDSYDYCKERNIYCIFANLENQGEIEGIKSIPNRGELKEKIDSL